MQGAISFEKIVSQFPATSHKAEFPICFNMGTNAIQVEICVAGCPKCGAFRYATQPNSDPGSMPKAVIILENACR